VVPQSRTFLTPSAGTNGTSSSAWLATLGDTFRRAAGSAGVVERHYRIADRQVCLRFAGPAMLEAIERSFAHLAIASDGADAATLTVELWDARSTGTEVPPLPAIDADEEAVGALYHYRDGHVRALYQPGFGALTVLSDADEDSGSQTAFYWMRSAEDLPYWERASPIRQLLHWWLASYDVQQVHAAAVGLPTGGVLLVGNPGSGKSTSALSSLESSLLFAGDDYVAVALEPEPFVYSLYSSGKVEPHHLQRLPHVGRSIANADRLDTEKAVIYAHDPYPERTTAGFPLRAVFLPKVRDQVDTRILPISRAAALHALAPSTVIQLHVAGPDALARMKALVTAVPAFVLELGSDIPAIPRTIGRFLQDGVAG
jgi:hypothetical protein